MTSEGKEVFYTEATWPCTSLLESSGLICSPSVHQASMLTQDYQGLCESGEKFRSRVREAKVSVISRADLVKLVS